MLSTCQSFESQCIRVVCVIIGHTIEHDENETALWY